MTHTHNIPTNISPALKSLKVFLSDISQHPTCGILIKRKLATLHLTTIVESEELVFRYATKVLEPEYKDLSDFVKNMVDSNVTDVITRRTNSNLSNNSLRYYSKSDSEDMLQILGPNETPMSLARNRACFDLEFAVKLVMESLEGPNQINSSEEYADPAEWKLPIIELAYRDLIETNYFEGMEFHLLPDLAHLIRRISKHLNR